jgi:hypothetical protein
MKIVVSNKQQVKRDARKSTLRDMSLMAGIVVVLGGGGWGLWKIQSKPASQVKHTASSTNRNGNASRNSFGSNPGDSQGSGDADAQSVEPGQGYAPDAQNSGQTPGYTAGAQNNPQSQTPTGGRSFGSGAFGAPSQYPRDMNSVRNSNGYSPSNGQTNNFNGAQNYERNPGFAGRNGAFGGGGFSQPSLGGNRNSSGFGANPNANRNRGFGSGSGGGQTFGRRTGFGRSNAPFGGGFNAQPPARQSNADDAQPIPEGETLQSEGTRVYFKDASGRIKPVPDGKYRLDDGEIMIVRGSEAVRH